MPSKKDPSKDVKSKARTANVTSSKRAAKRPARKVSGQEPTSAKQRAKKRTNRSKRAKRGLGRLEPGQVVVVKYLRGGEEPWYRAFIVESGAIEPKDKGVFIFGEWWDQRWGEKADVIYRSDINIKDTLDFRKVMGDRPIPVKGRAPIVCENPAPVPWKKANRTTARQVRVRRPAWVRYYNEYFYSDPQWPIPWEEMSEVQRLAVSIGVLHCQIPSNGFEFWIDHGFYAVYTDEIIRQLKKIGTYAAKAVRSLVEEVNKLAPMTLELSEEYTREACVKLDEIAGRLEQMDLEFRDYDSELMFEVEVHLLLMQQKKPRPKPGIRLFS